MKKVFLIMAAGLFLAACGNDPMYTTATKAIYGYDKDGNPFMFKEHIYDNASVTNFKNKKGILIKDENSKLELQLVTSPAQVIGTDFDGSDVNWEQTNGYKMKVKNSNDTLYVAYGPTEDTPNDFPKKGVVYQFYK